MNPGLPCPVYTAFNGTTKLFTKDQLLAYRAEVIEMCAKEAATLLAHNGSSKAIDAISASVCLIRNLI